MTDTGGEGRFKLHTILESEIEMIKRKNFLSVALTAGAVFASVATAFVAFSVQDVRQRSDDAAMRTAELQKQMNVSAGTMDIIKSMRSDIGLLKERQAALRGNGPQPVSSQQYADLSSRMTALDVRETKLEQVILADPSKALEMPLLRRDMDSNKEYNLASLSEVKAEIDRIYDLSKWLIGGLTISIISLAIASLLKFGKEKT